MNCIGFDNEKYLQIQSQHIRQRIAQFGGKLYLEFGGKLYDDHHAARVLPGFQPDSKLRMLLQLKDQVEVVIAINAGDIEKNKIRGERGRRDGRQTACRQTPDRACRRTGRSGPEYAGTASEDTADCRNRR